MPCISQPRLTGVRKEAQLSTPKSTVKEESFFRDLVAKTWRTSNFLRLERRHEHFLQLLSHFASLGENWDSYESPPPSSEVVASATRFLKKLHDDVFLPSSIAPSAEGGIAIYFNVSDKSAYAEYRNSGQLIVAMYNEEQDPIVIELSTNNADEARAITNIRQYLS